MFKSLQSFAYQTAVALRVEVICPYLFRRRLTATSGQTGHPEGQALLGDKVWTSLRIRWIEVALARLDIHHSRRSDSIWGWIIPDAVEVDMCRTGRQALADGVANMSKQARRANNDIDFGLICK